MFKWTLGKIATPDVACVPGEAIVFDAISAMREKKISCLVVTSGKKPIGLFTESDMLKAISKNIDLKTVFVKDEMTSPAITAPSSTELHEVFDLFLTRSIRHLPIVDKNGEVAGIVTQSDLVKNLDIEYFVELRKISNIMDPNVVTVGCKEYVGHAISVMASRRATYVVAVDGARPVGIITERDIARFAGLEAVEREESLEEFMSFPVVTISSDAPVHEGARVMASLRIRRLVVVDPTGAVIGIVTQGELLRGVETRYIKYLKDLVLDRENKLSYERDKLRLIYEYSPDGVVVMEKGRKIIYANSKAEELLGAVSGKLMALDCKEVLPSLCECCFFENSHDRHSPLKELTVKFKERWIWQTCYLIRDRDGETETVALLRDVTAKREAEEEREELIKRLEGALRSVKVMQGLLPICASCKRIKDKSGKWHRIENYIEEHTTAEFTHGLCPECSGKFKDEPA